MRKLLLTFLLFVGISFSQGVDTRIMYLLENYDFSEIDADTIDTDYLRADEIFITDGLTTTGAVFTLQTNEPSVVDGDVLGQIDFQAPLETGADALLVSASIWAEADDTFAADNNKTSLVFATGASEVAAEKMRLDNVGALTVTGAISGTSLTGTGKISTIVATKQFELGYDATNLFDITLLADGHTTFTTVDPDGAEADININPDGNVGIKTAAPSVALDVTGAGKFSTDLTVTGGDITGANGNAIDIGEATDGTITISRDDSGAMILTTADDDANADFTIVPGGTGNLLLGDSGGSVEIVSDDWTISTTGAMANIGDVGCASVTSTGGVDLGTSQALVGTTALTIGDGTQTGAVSTSDWTISATGDLAKIGTIKTQSNIGAVEGNGVTAVEYGDGYNHVTILTLVATILGVPDPGNNLAIGDTIYVFPAGAQLIEAMDMNMALTVAGETGDTPELGLGSVMGAAAHATLGAAGATMEDYWEGTAVDSCGGTAEALGIKGATAGYGTGIALNNSTDVKYLCINAADGWHASVTGNLTADGTVAIKWTTLR